MDAHEESYSFFVLPPDWVYSLSADIDEARAADVARALGVPLPPPGGSESISFGRSCERVIDWNPPRLTFSESCT